MQDIQSHLDPVWQRLDEHGQSINILKQGEKLNAYRLDQIETSSREMCRQMAETRQELVTIVNSSFAGLSGDIRAIQAAQSEDRGAKTASGRSWYFVFGILSAVLVLAQLYVLIRK